MKGDKNIIGPAGAEPGVLLKNGLIVDGTGRKGFAGDLLIKGPRIEQVSEKPIELDCTTIDCTGKVIAPGFIDAHSHMDGTLAYQGHEDLKAPFTVQGCTTFVAVMLMGSDFVISLSLFCGHRPWGLGQL